MTIPPLLLECRDVSAGYRGSGGAPRVVLSGIHLTIPGAGRLVVIGRSGSGKSTLLRLLNRLEAPLSGAVLYEGRPIEHADPLALRRKVALVLQTPTVFDGTVRNNLATRPFGVAAPEEGHLEALLLDVGLSGDFLDREARALSVGEKQRVCLARALVAEPRALLLDEPTSALDPQSVGRVADLVLALAERRALSLVVATHQSELARRLGANVLLLAGGTARVTAPGDVARFFEGE